MGRAEQVQELLEARERGRAWCKSRHSHTVLMGEYECFVCGEELPPRALQVATIGSPFAEPPFDFGVDMRFVVASGRLDVRFVAAAERFETPDGLMRASDGLCRCGRRGLSHKKMYPWPTWTRRDCEGFVAVERVEARGSTRVPRARQDYVERSDGVRVYENSRRCVCGHLEADHSNHWRRCLRCGCQQLTVR